MSQTLEYTTPGDPPEWLRIVQQKVESLRYGVVQLVVHDGRVTQIERTEKTRLNATGARENSTD
jgi:hypothetical protein